MAIGDEVNKLGDEAINALNALDQIQKTASENANLLEDVSKRLISNTLSGSKKIATELSKVNKDTVKSLKEQKKVRDAIRESQREIVKLERQGYYFLQRSLTATAEEAKIYKKLSEDYYNAADNLARQAEAAEDLVGSFDKLNRSTKFFQAMADLVDDIPVLRRLFSEFRKAAEASEQAGGGTKGFLQGLLTLATSVFKATIGFVVKGLTMLDTLIVDVGRGLGVAGREASQLTSSIASTGMLLDESKQSVIGFQKAMGAAAGMTPKLAQSVTVVAARMGLGADQAARLYEMSTLTGQTLDETVKEISGVTQVQNGLNERAFSYYSIMDDIASASEYTRLSISKFEGGIAQAAFRARQLGLNFNVLEGSAGNLLNFESSIAAELEAELLLNRQLNLQKARQFALTGDLAGLAGEIVEQVGTEQEFLEMNVIERQALAKALGTTVEEISKGFAIRRRDAALARIQNNAEFKKLDIQQKLNTYMNMGYSRQEAMNKLQKEYGDQAYTQAVSQETMLQKIQKFLEQLTLSFGDDFQAVIKHIKTGLDGLVANIDKIKLAFKAVAQLPIISNLLKFFRKSGDSATKAAGDLIPDSSSPTGYRDAKGRYAQAPKTAQKAAGKGGGFLGKIFGKGALKGLGKAGSKMIPGVGLFYAIQALLEEDIFGFLLNLGSAVFSMIPGLGSAVAGGLSAIDLGRDVYKMSTQPQDLQVDDFTIRTNPKDTLVMAGGTKLGDETNMLLKELITAVKSGGHVYLDGRKVGESLALSYNTQ